MVLEDSCQGHRTPRHRPFVLVNAGLTEHRTTATPRNRALCNWFDSGDGGISKSKKKPFFLKLRTVSLPPPPSSPSSPTRSITEFAIVLIVLATLWCVGGLGFLLCDLVSKCKRRLHIRNLDTPTAPPIAVGVLVAPVVVTT